MKKRAEEICASFIVETEDHELKQVLVTQETLSLYSKKENYSKNLRLESLAGVTVYRTKDPDIYQLANGTILKKRTGKALLLK